jgi:hypothetical protein
LTRNQINFRSRSKLNFTSPDFQEWLIYLRPASLHCRIEGPGPFSDPAAETGLLEWLDDHRQQLLERLMYHGVNHVRRDHFAV